MISASIPNHVRKEVYRRDGFRCALCDSTQYLQIHHYEPRSRGGVDHPMNLITLCSKCHALAHGMDLDSVGLTPEDVRQNIAEYLGDYYAPDWYPWEG